MGAGTFGVKSKGTSENNDDEQPAPVVDIGDEDLLEVMEQFALMSGEERKEAFRDVMDMLGKDDPDMIAAVTEIMNEIDKMDEADASLLVDDIINSVEKATDTELDMIATSAWELIYDKRGDILDSIIESGHLSAEDAALYKSDDDAWTKVLRADWDGLQEL